MRGVTQSERSTIGVLVFQLTRLMRGVTDCLSTPRSSIMRFQLTRLMRGVTVNVLNVGIGK